MQKENKILVVLPERGPLPDTLSEMKTKFAKILTVAKFPEVELNGNLAEFNYVVVINDLDMIESIKRSRGRRLLVALMQDPKELYQARIRGASVTLDYNGKIVEFLQDKLSLP